MFEVFDKTSNTQVGVTWSYFEACDIWMDRRTAFPGHDVEIFEYPEFEEN